MGRPYLSNLTESQWNELRRTVFRDSAPSVRGIVDGILYHERACLVWWLPPEGFPPASVLEQHAEQWRQDGTWERVREVVPRTERKKESIAESELGSLKSIRCAVSRITHAVPGGGGVLAAARLPIQLGQFAQRLTSPHHWWLWRFLGANDRGDRRLLKKDYRGAIRAYDRAIELAPWHAHPRVGRAHALYEQKRYSEVIAECRFALSASVTNARIRHDAHGLIARSMALAGGDLTLAVRHLAESWWANDNIREGQQEGHGPLTQLDALMTAHDALAEYAINVHMAFPTALALYRHKPADRATLIEPLSRGPVRDFIQPPGLILSPDWVRNIGHTAYLDTIAKMRMLGWEPPTRMALLAPPHATANLHYAKYWSRYYDVITDTKLVESLEPFARSFGPRVASMVCLPDGTDRYFLESLGIVQEAWEREDRPPLLELTPEDQDFGRRLRKRLGMPDDAWFVCLHVREPGYHNEIGNIHQSHRNADIRTYLPAIREITRRGGWVIRMGDSTMSRLPNLAGVVDFAHSKHKSSRADIVFCASCRFFLGVASGLCQIPTTFGRPCVLTNWVSNALPLYSRNDLFIPKMLRHLRTRRVLSFEEMYSTMPRQAAYSGAFLRKQRLEAIANTPDELRELVVEMLDRLDGRTVHMAKDDEQQEQFGSILRAAGVDGFARVGRDFLRRHAELLPANSRTPVLAAA